jgi:hypothetical protein
LPGDEGPAAGEPLPLRALAVTLTVMGLKSFTGGLLVALAVAVAAPVLWHRIIMAVSALVLLQ